MYDVMIDCDIFAFIRYQKVTYLLNVFYSRVPFVVLQVGLWSSKAMIGISGSTQDNA